MSAVIDPTIHDGLTRYANRQRRWIVLRAGLIALAVWILAILVVTWIDAAWIIERGTRSLLTLAAYVSAASVFVTLVLWRLKGRSPMRSAALALEGARPEMHDRLLCAVELADAADRNSLAGSRAFIQATQRDVALKISRLDISKLLPLRVLRRPMVAATALLAAATCLVLVPDLNYGNRFARAIIPGIDLDRVSQTRILILRPDPASRSVPADELTAVTIQTFGRPAADARLQWESENGQRGMLTMNQLEDTAPLVAPEPSSSSLRFAINVPVQRAPLRYRILAGDGVTAWHRLQPQARPSAIEFAKQITPPPYSRLPSRTETSADGELRGLRGSTARLSVRFDMPVVDATVRILGDDRRIAMSGAGDTWTVSLPLDRDDRYQVLARDEVTGFDNSLSPQYAIVAHPDQPPLVNWLELDDEGLPGGEAGARSSGMRRFAPAPRGSSDARRRLVTSRSTLSLAAKIADEMPIERTFQETALNTGPWKLTARDETIPSAQPRATTVLNWSWDLTELASEEAPLRPGDLIRTRVVAIDRQGQRGESEIREYLISDQALDARRRANVIAWAALAGKVDDWKKSVIDELVSLEIESPPTAPADATPEADAGGQDEEIPAAPRAQQTAALLEQLAAMTRAAIHDSEAGELELLGRGIARIDQDLVRAAVAEKSELKEFNSLRKSADLVANAVRYATAHRLSVTLAEDLDRMLRAMRPLVSDQSAIQWQSFGRYHQVTQQQFREILDLIARMQRTVPDSTRNHNEQLRRWIEGWINRLADNSGPDIGEDRVRATTRDLVNDLGSRRRYGMLDGRLPSLLVEAHNRLSDLAQWNAPALYQAQKMAADMRARRRDEDRDSDQAKAASDLQQQLSQRLGQIAEQLDRDAEMNLRRGEADRRYVADARMMRRVLEIIGDRDYTPPEGKSLDEVLAELALAFHQLEAGHWWTQGLAELRTLADTERWDIDSAAARLDAPMRWDRIQRGLDQALAGLDRAKIPWELRQGLHNEQHSRETSKIAGSITSRRWQQIPATSLADELDAKHAAFETAGQAITPALAEARRRIEAYLPDLAAMARGAADRLRQAEKLAKQEAGAPKDAADEVQKHRQQAQQQADKLREALVDEANTQDLTTGEGLRKARDADIASRAIEQQMKAAGEAVDEAVRQAQQGTDQASAEQAIRDAAGPLADAAQTLEQIAQHYEQAVATDPSDPAAEPSSLAALEQELELREQLDAEFARSQSLAETLQSDPRALLKKLSEELKRNQRMRQELSEIAERSIQDAQRSLQQQADRERQLRLELEKQDPRTLARKRQLEETIRVAAENAAAVQRALLHAAKQAAARMGNLPEGLMEQAQGARERLDAASQQLQQSAQELSSIKSAEQELWSDLLQRARQLHDQLASTVESLDQSERLLEQLGKNPAAALAGDQQKAEQRDMQNLQRQARDTLIGAARNQQNRVSRTVTTAEQQLRQIRVQTQQAERQLIDVEKRLEKNREDSGLQQQRDRAAARLQTEKLRLEIAEEDLQERRHAVEQARQRLAEIGRTPLPPLDSPRPAAELAEGMQERGIVQLRKEQEQLSAATGAFEQAPALRAAGDLLSTTEQAQGDVQGEVQRAAENLQRAARHQERLGDQRAAERLANIAQAVRQVADQEVHQARQAIAQAAQQARAEPQPMVDADAANQMLGGAEQAISAQVQALLDAIAQAAEDAATPDGQPGDSRAAAARQLAQTLDELDRSLTQSRQRPPENQQPQPADQPGEPGEPGEDPPAGQGSPSPPSSPTLAAAARRQMQQMAMQRTMPGDGQSSQASQGTTPEGEPQDGPPGEGESEMSGPGSQGTDPSLFRLPGVDPGSDGDWGKLRTLQAEDTSVQRRVEVSPEFRRQIEAYFRVIAEQAKGD